MTIISVEPNPIATTPDYEEMALDWLVRPSVVELRNVVRVFKSEAGEFVALDNVTLTIERGEFVAILGRSGSGKSTLLNMINGIDRPTSGNVVVAGAAVHAMTENELAIWRGSNVGIVFQFFQLLPTLSALDNIILAMEFANVVTKSERRLNAMRLLEQVGLAEQAHKLPDALSGGQQQRVAIARALANGPSVLIADEPTGNLDSKSAENIITLFEQLASAGMTIVMVTHDEDLAQRAGRQIVMDDGRIATP